MARSEDKGGRESRGVRDRTQRQAEPSSNRVDDGRAATAATTSAATPKRISWARRGGGSAWRGVSHLRSDDRRAADSKAAFGRPRLRCRASHGAPLSRSSPLRDTPLHLVVRPRGSPCTQKVLPLGKLGRASSALRTSYAATVRLLHRAKRKKAVSRKTECFFFGGGGGNAIEIGKLYGSLRTNRFFSSNTSRREVPCRVPFGKGSKIFSARMDYKMKMSKNRKRVEIAPFSSACEAVLARVRFDARLSDRHSC